MSEAIQATKQFIRERITELEGTLASLDRLFGEPEDRPRVALAIPAPVVRLKPGVVKPKPVGESKGRVSKYPPLLGKCLATGPKRPFEIAAELNAQSPCWMPQLEKRPDLFKRNGEGRDATWELTDAGRREFAGKA